MRTNPRGTRVRFISVVSGAAALVLAAAGGAAAHITVHSADAQPGGSGTLIFTVPNEEANASTTKVEIDLPTATPLSGISVTPPSGWKADVTGTSIVFSGGMISGTNDAEFPVHVGTLPSSGTLVFKAMQTYSDGNVVRWIEQAAPGAPEPAHPAPTLDLSNPNKVDSNTDRDEFSAATASPAATSSSRSSSSSSGSSSSGSSSSGSSSSSSPSSVKAGTGGQAAGDSGVPVAPVPFVLAGLAAAAYGARRLIRH